jgi:hypothetical protein
MSVRFLLFSNSSSRGFFLHERRYIFRSRDANSAYIVSLRIEIDITYYIDRSIEKSKIGCNQSYQITQFLFLMIIPIYSTEHSLLLMITY